MKRYLAIFTILVILVTMRRLGFVGDTPPSRLVAEFIKPSIAANEISYRPNEIYPMAEGNYYRMTFYARKGLRQSDGNSLTVVPATLAPSQIRVYLISKLNAKSLLGEATVLGDVTSLPVELRFKAPADGDHIVIVKSDPADPHDLYFNTFGLSRLFVTSVEEMDRLAPTIFGIDKEETLVEQTSGQTEIFRLRKTKSAVGQIFQSKGGQISHVSFRLALDGANIKGPFILRLQEVKRDKNRYVLSPVVLTSSQLGLEDILRARDLNSPLSDVYRFPLRATLEKDTYYFVGLDSSVAHLNFLNAVQFYGRLESAGGGGEAVMFSGETTPSQQTGSLYFRLTGQALASDANVFPQGVVMEDTGRMYTYTYQSPDNYAASVFAAGQSDKVSVYRFNLAHPLSQAAINLETGSSQYNVEFSLDGQRWQKMPYNEDPAMPANGTFWATTLNGNGQMSSLDIRLTRLAADETNSTGGIFGIKQVKIYAELRK